MRERHGGALLLQSVEPIRLVGTMMSVAMSNGEDWVHFAFSNEVNEFELTNNGVDTRVILSRPVAFSLVALLRVALAQFSVLRGDTGTTDDGRAERTAGAVVRAEAARRSVTITWPSDVEGVRWRIVEEPGRHVELRADVGAAIEAALVASLATLAAGTRSS